MNEEEAAKDAEQKMHTVCIQVNESVKFTERVEMHNSTTVIGTFRNFCFSLLKLEIFLFAL